LFEHIKQRLSAGNVVILDGGTGTDIQKRGAPMDGETWCAQANLTHPEIVRAVHEGYIRAGADVITANTYASSPVLFHHLGRLDEIRNIDQTAVRLARQAIRDAAEAPVALAGSFSLMRPVTKGSATTHRVDISARDLSAMFKAKAEGLAEAGCDLIIMEMMREVNQSLLATEAAVATGLPVWVGISVERREDGRLAGYQEPHWTLEDLTNVLMGTGAEVCLVMHNEISTTPDAIQIIKSQWAGTIGAYPEAGRFVMPDWHFEEIAPEDYVEEAKRWHRLGATVIGGCCGIGPDHIAALAAHFKHGDAR